VLRDYQAEFISEIDVDLITQAGFKVVIDYSYGSSSQVFPTLFTRLSISATELNANPSPRKFAVSPEEQAQALVQLSAIVRSLNADIGFRMNSAAEKLSVVDEQGMPLDSQTLLLIVLELFLETHGPGKIAVPVAASAGAEEIAGRYASEVIRVSDDHWAMMEARRSGRVSFVGGTRGGFIFPGFQTGADAILSAVKILEMLARTRSRLGQLRKKHEHYVRQKVSVPCPWSKRGTVMRRLITESDNKERQLIDGVRIFEDDGWVLVIPDRLKASFNVLAESTSSEVTSGLINRYRTLVEKIQEN
jgi:mannose-1-phosphate guanylyltransferase/phosphomannomutase